MSHRGIFLTFPVTLSGATFVYHRWFPPGFAVLSVVAAPRDLFVREGRMARIALGVLPVATLLLAWPAFAHSNQAYAALDEITGQIEPASAVTEIDLGKAPGEPPRVFSLAPAAGRVLAMRGGRLSYAFTDSPVSPVVLERKYAWDESLVRVGFDSYAFRPAQDFHRYRYVLLRGRDPALTVFAIRALLPEAEYVTDSGEWVLFKSRLHVMPVRSRDFWLYGPPPENLRDRIRVLRGDGEKDADPRAARGDGLSRDPPLP